MFRELLDRVLRETPGALGVTLMGFDGIAVDASEASGAGDVNSQAVAVELGAIASQLRGVSEGLGSGEVQELTVHTSGLVTVLRPISPQYFLALTLRPDGNTGKGRFLMRLIAPKLVAGL